MLLYGTADSIPKNLKLKLNYHKGPLKDTSEFMIVYIESM